MDLALLRALQGVRNPVLDVLFQGITMLGEETLLIAALCLIYWCINKRAAIQMMMNFFVVGLVTQALKITFCVPRPWVRDPSLVPVASAKEGASGFSFPSGHTASAVAMYGSAALLLKKRWATCACVATALLVGFSRLYLGVHTPQDVLVSMVLSTLLLIGVRSLFSWMERDAKTENIVFAAGLLISVALAVYAQYKPYPAMEGVEHLALDTFKISGAAIGLFLGWQFERKFVKFDERASFSMQVLKYVIGMALVGGIMALKGPVALFGAKPWALIKYSLLAFTALGLWPMLFSRLSRKSCENVLNGV